MPRTFYAVFLACAALICARIAAPRAAEEGALSGTFTDWSRHPAIAYSSHPTTDPVAELGRQVFEGKVQLRRDGASGYLRSVLDALQVPVESQIVVFAKDSVQAARITATNPRSLFFNDRVAVGWVRGGVIYSPLFDGLPAAAREAIYARLFTVLSGKDRASAYSRLTGEDRTAILDILRSTKTGLPAYFTPAARR